MNKLSFMIVDDHRLFREGLMLLLGNLTFTGQILEADSGEEFLSILQGGLRPEIIFMDIKMGGINGIETTRKALELDPSLNIIGLSMFSDEDYYTGMIEAGAKGFILKNSGIREVEEAVLRVNEGNNYFSPEILSSLISKLSRPPGKEKTESLSKREEEVLLHVCKGYSNQEIADLLNISKRTVDKHRENILLKTNCKNTAGLVIYAIKKGILNI